MTNVRAFKDGNRLVLVIEDAGETMEQWVKSIITGDMEAVQHLAPPPPMGRPVIKEEEMSEIKRNTEERHKPDPAPRTAKFLQDHNRTDGMRTINVSASEHGSASPKEEEEAEPNGAIPEMKAERAEPDHAVQETPSAISETTKAEQARNAEAELAAQNNTADPDPAVKPESEREEQTADKARIEEDAGAVNPGGEMPRGRNRPTARDLSVMNVFRIRDLILSDSRSRAAAGTILRVQEWALRQKIMSMGEKDLRNLAFRVIR